MLTCTAVISSRRATMRTSSSSDPKPPKSRKPFQFKTVSFGDGAQAAHSSAPQSRAEPLPFIITHNGRTPSQSSSLIKRTVMQDFISKGKKQVSRYYQTRRSRTAYFSPYSRELRSIRPRDGNDQDLEVESASRPRTSESVSRLDENEALEGYTLRENGALISFGIKSEPPSLLGPLGAGRVDPFDSYPTHYKNHLVTSQLLDHCNDSFSFVRLSTVLPLCS